MFWSPSWKTSTEELGIVSSQFPSFSGGCHFFTTPVFPVFVFVTTTCVFPIALQSELFSVCWCDVLFRFGFGSPEDSPRRLGLFLLPFFVFSLPSAIFLLYSFPRCGGEYCSCKAHESSARVADTRYDMISARPPPNLSPRFLWPSVPRRCFSLRASKAPHAEPAVSDEKRRPG